MSTYLVPLTKTTLRNVDVIELITPPIETKTFYLAINDNTFSGAYAQAVWYKTHSYMEDLSSYTVVHYSDFPNNYEYYKGNLRLPKTFFPESEKDTIIKEALQHKEEKAKTDNVLKQKYENNWSNDIQDEYDYIDKLFSYLRSPTSPESAAPDPEEEPSMKYFQINWGDHTSILASKAIPENWSNNTYPDNGILKNYISHTYKKLAAENNIIETPEYGLFNTGLYTKYYDEIYAYSDQPKKIEFLTGYELNSRGIEARPQKANYFEDPNLLVFDWHYPINIQFDHILDDERNKLRLPEGFLEKNNKMCILTGAVELMKSRVAANYKLAVPQYYDGKLQLLLPLCLDTDDNHPNLALAVTKLKTCYQGHTCLTLDMAYNNARLIAKPESQWLK